MRSDVDCFVAFTVSIAVIIVLVVFIVVAVIIAVYSAVAAVHDVLCVIFLRMVNMHAFVFMYFTTALASFPCFLTRGYTYNPLTSLQQHQYQFARSMQ